MRYDHPVRQLDDSQNAYRLYAELKVDKTLISDQLIIEYDANDFRHFTLDLF